jgi:hypothetical protein
MANKTKSQSDTTIDNIKTAVSHVGFAAMTLATMVSMVELSERTGHKTVAVLQPAPSYVVADNYTENAGGGMHEELRRGAKEEIRHTSASYGVQMKQDYVSGNR